ncbi:MAG: polyprenyl synthetase family protein [Deltaproteobacteria bacterium]|nr:polyprenyl synthetase family protein [Deltaproteobacteria bacterium]
MTPAYLQSSSSRADTRLEIEHWLSEVRSKSDHALVNALGVADEAGVEPRWQQARRSAFDYALRPGKRFRAALLASAYSLARGHREVPSGIWKFAAGIELLHVFMLVHDDIADRAETRRRGVALHRVLGSGKKGDDLGVIMGDYFFARAIEVMLGAEGVTHAARVVKDYLAVCRETAAGQYLDVDLGDEPMGSITLFRTLKVAYLKTARYGFVAPLVAGAKLAGAPNKDVELLERIGRHLGVGYQLADDLIGFFGDQSVAGKATDADFVEGKRTFPVIAAYIRAPESARAEMAALWSSDRSSEQSLQQARSLVARHGGREVTERRIRHAQRAALHLIAKLPNIDGCRSLLEHIASSLGTREV